MSDALLQLHDISKNFGAVQALAGVTADISGQVIGLLGPNGAGKSTLLKAMLGLMEFSGSARVLGLDPAKEAFAIRDRVGYMPEMDAYLTDMTAVEQCTYAAQLSGLPRAEAMQRAHAALYFANLEDKRYQKVQGYSTGLKQRVKLAQALVHDPDLLFLDEPTNGLDPRARDEMLELIAELPGKRGCSVLLSTHLLPDVERICDRVVIMKDGKLRYSGTLLDLRATTTETTVLRIEVKGDLTQVMVGLQAANCGVEQNSPAELLVTLPEGADTALVLQEVRAAGGQLRGLEPHALSLQAAFLRELEDEVA